MTKSHRPRQGDVDATPRRLPDLFSEDAPNFGGEVVSGSPTDAGLPARTMAEDCEAALGGKRTIRIMPHHAASCRIESPTRMSATDSVDRDEHPRHHTNGAGKTCI